MPVPILLLVLNNNKKIVHKNPAQWPSCPEKIFLVQTIIISFI